MDTVHYVLVVELAGDIAERAPGLRTNDGDELPTGDELADALLADALNEALGTDRVVGLGPFVDDVYHFEHALTEYVRRRE